MIIIAAIEFATPVASPANADKIPGIEVASKLMVKYIARMSKKRFITELIIYEVQIQLYKDIGILIGQ